MAKLENKPNHVNEQHHLQPERPTFFPDQPVLARNTDCKTCFARGVFPDRKG
jgi:hypothetical protein